MTNADLGAFSDVFDALSRMLIARRLDDHERARLLSDYFKALRGYPLQAVQAGAEIVMQRAKHFPKPIEWSEAIPRVDAYEDALPMTTAEAAIWREAERRAWEGEPCFCDACKAAGVDHRPIRFVPDVDHLGRDRRVRDVERNRVVVDGHWAHGTELSGYYRARTQCFNANRLVKVLSMGAHQTADAADQSRGKGWARLSVADWKAKQSGERS